jgi:hypothetical protein
VGGVSVGDEMSPRQNAQTHTRFLQSRTWLPTARRTFPEISGEREHMRAAR